MSRRRLVHGAWASLTLALLVAACTKAPFGETPGIDASVPCEDRDHDGFGRGCERGYDCNDDDPHSTTECRTCSKPERGCDCSPGEGPVSCFLDDTPLEEGDVLCSEGTRHCRNGLWSGCEDVHQYVASKAPDTQRIIDPTSGKLPCSVCDVKCFQVVDNLLSDGGVAGGNVTFGPGGGITLLPGDGGAAGSGGDGGVGSGLTGCAAMMACCSTLSDNLKTACEATAMVGNNTTCDRDRSAYCPSGTVTGPVPGCTLGSGADTDCDGIPNVVDSYPGKPLTTTNNQAIFHQLDIGETGRNSMEITFKLRNADVYFLLDMTNTMKEERDNLIGSLTTGNVINCAHLNQCCNRETDATKKLACQKAVNDNTNKLGKADNQTACLTEQSTYCPGNRPVDCPDADGNGLPDNFLKTQGVVGATRCLVGSSWFGAGFSRELPVVSDPIGCSSGSCSRKYADRDEQLFKNVIDLTPDYSKVSTALQSMTTDGNWDEPEGGLMALYSVITGRGHYFGINRPSIPPRIAATACPPNTFGYPCFRKDAVPIIVFFTDRPHHNGPKDPGDCNGEGDGCPYDQLSKNSSTWASGASESSSDKQARFVPLSAETFSTAYNAGDVRGQYLTLVGDTRFMAGDYPTAITGCGAAPDAPDALIRFRVSTPTGVMGTVPPIPVNFHITKDDAYSDPNLYGTWRTDRTNDPTPATEFGSVLTVFRGVPNSVSSTIDLGDRQAYAIASGPDSTYLTYTGTTMGMGSAPGFLGGISDCAADGLTNQMLFTFRPTANARIIVDASESSFPGVVSLHSGLPSSLPKNPNTTDGTSEAIANNNDTFATANALPSSSTSIDGAYLERTGDSNVAAIHADYTSPVARGVMAVRTNDSNTLTQVKPTDGLQVGMELQSSANWSVTPVRVESIGTETVKLTGKWLGTDDLVPGTVTFVDSLVGCGVDATGRETVFKFNVATPRRVRIDTEGTTFDTVISLHDAPPPTFVTKSDVGSNATAPGYSIGDVYNTSYTLQDIGGGTSSFASNYQYGQCGASTDSKDAVLKFTLSKPTHVALDVDASSWSPIVGLFSSPPGTTVVFDNAANNNDRLTAPSTVFDLGDIYGAVDTDVKNSDLGSMSDDWQVGVVGCGATAPSKDQIFKFTPLESTRARITATPKGSAWNPIVAVFDDPPPSSSVITTSAAFDAATVTLPDTNCLAYSFHDPAAAAPAHTYSVCPTKRYSTDADSRCVSAGMSYLASINSAEEQAFLMKTALPTYATNFHMGGVDPEGDNTFVWRDGTALGYNNWSSSEPNGAAINNKCADISATGTWVDGKCTAAGAALSDNAYYVCEDNSPAVLPNEDAATAYVVPAASTRVVTGNTRRMSSDYNGALLLSACGGTISGGDAVFQITTGSGTSYPLVVDSAGSSYGVVLGLFDGVIDAGHYLACDAPAGGVLTHMLLPSRTYYILVKGTSATPEGQYKLKFSNASSPAATGAELTCARATTITPRASVEVDVDANHTYYVVVDHADTLFGKYDLEIHSLFRSRSEVANAEATNETSGNAVSLPDPYRSRVTVVDTSTAGMSADYGNSGANGMCTTSASAPDAVYKFTPSLTTNVTFTVQPQGTGLNNVGIGVFDGPPGTSAVLHDLTATGNANESATSAELVSVTGPAQLYQGNTSGMSPDVDPSVLSCGARPNGHDAVFSFTLAKQTDVEIDASSSGVSDPVINLLRSGPLSKPAKATLENDTKANADIAPSPTPNATANWLYYGADFNNLSAESQVPVSLAAVNDDAPPGTLQPQDLGDVSGKRFVLSGGDTGPMLSDYPGNWSCGGNDAAPDALYKFFSATGGTVHVKATPQSGFDAVIGLFDGNNGPPLRLSDVGSLVEDTACVPTTGPKNLTNTTLKSISAVVAASPNISLNCGDSYVITNDPDAAGAQTVSFQNWCGTQPTMLVQQQPDGPALVIFVTKSMQIAAGSSLRVLGSRPAVFVVSGTATITGQLSAKPDPTNFAGIPGAGGDFGCGLSYGGNALSSGNNSGGGGGGGFATAGGPGGFGSSSSVAGGAGGSVRVNSTLVPLVGGCSGGDGLGSSGGLAAGALQISATTSIVLAAGTGSVVADGGNGVSGASGEAGGSGAGSGGAIMLQAPTITYVANQLTARGGSGGQGLGSPSTSGGTGAVTSAAAGTTGQNSNAAAGGGGGGGGYGRVIVVGSAAVSLAPCTTATNENASSAWPIMLDTGREYIERGNTSTMLANHDGMCGTPIGAPDAVYAFTLSQASTVQINAASSPAGTVIGLYNAASLGQSPIPAAVQNDDRAAADLNPTPTQDAANGWLAYKGDFVNLTPSGQPQTSVDNTGNANEIIPTELPDPIDRRVTVLNANTSTMTADYLAPLCSTSAADAARDAIYRFVPTKAGPVRVSANYSQTLFNPVIALYRGAHDVMDERVTLVNQNESTLAKLNVDTGTIKVYNLARNILYASSDYTVVVRDAITPVVIKRTAASTIPNGIVVSVDYVYDSGAPLPISQQQLTQVNLGATGNTNENATTAAQVPTLTGRAYQYTGDTTAMGSDIDGALFSCGPPALGARDATFDFSLDQSTTVAISTEGSSFDTTIALFSAPYTRPSTSVLYAPAPYSSQLYDVHRVPGSPETTCSPYSYGGSRFWICSTARPWGQAEGMCRAVGLHLATIDNSGENAALLTQIQGTTFSHHIGFAETLPYTDSWGTWTSGGGGSTGQQVSSRFVRWAANEPNGSGDCLQMLSDGTWDDTLCATAKSYICERNDATPTSPPSSGTCGSVLAYGGHSYYACTDKLDWAGASARCTSANMRLARADDLPENDQLRALLAGSSGWVGGSDSVTEGMWFWADGAGFWEVTAFRNWANLEPDQPTTNPGSRMLSDTGLWVDTPATTGNFPYICEDPTPPSSLPTPPTVSTPEIVNVFSARRQFTGSTEGVATSVGGWINSPGCVNAGAAADAVFSVHLDYRTTLSLDITGSFTGSLVGVFKDTYDAAGYAAAGSRCGLGLSGAPQLTATLDPGQYFVVITGTSAAASGVYNLRIDAQTSDAAAFSMRNDTVADAIANPLGSVDGKWLVKKTAMAGLLPTIGASTSVDMGTGTDSNDVNATPLGTINNNRVVVSNASTGDLNNNYPAGSCDATASGADALYSFVAPDADPIQVRFTPAGWSGQVVVYDGLPLDTLNAPLAPISLAPAYGNETPALARAATIAKPQAYLGNLTMMANDVPAAAFNQSFNAGSGSPTTCNADPTGSDAFFKFTVGSVAQEVEISSAGSAIAHTIALWDDKPFAKPTPSTLEYDSRSAAIATPLGGTDIDDTWVVARGDMSHLTPYNGYTTITETVDYARNDTVHDLGNVNGKEVITVNASTTGLAGDYLATTLQCGGSDQTSPDAIFSFTQSGGGKVRLSLNNPMPVLAPTLAVFRGAPLTAAMINPTQIVVPNANEATTSAFPANDPAAAIIYTGSTAAMMNNYPGNVFTQGTAYGSHVCTADAGSTGKDAFIKFTVPGATAKEIEISSLAATFDQTISLYDSTPIIEPTMSTGIGYETRSAAFSNTSTIDNDWVLKTATMSGLMPAALTATPLTTSSTPAVNNNDEVQDLTATNLVGKRITFSANTTGLAGDYTAGAGGAVSCGTSTSAPDIIYKVRPTTNTKIRAAVNNPSTPVTSTAIAVLDGSTGHPQRLVDSTPATLSTAACSSAFNYTPSNFVLGAAAGQVKFTSALNVTLSCGLTLTYNSGTDTWSNLCGMASKPPMISVSQGSGGADLVVLAFKSLTLSNGTNITITGTKGVVFAVEGSASIAGAIRANAAAATANGGGNSYCSTGSASGAPGDKSTFEEAGAGGGSFGTKGGNGGDGGAFTTPGSSGAIRGATSTPLMSGCNGGIGPSCGATTGGAGGGVIQISAGGAVTVTSTGSLQANGGTPSCAGSGGGSGGAIFLEGNTVTTTGATIEAKGGNGAAISFAGGGTGGTTVSDPGNAGGEFGLNGGGGGGGYGRFFTRAAPCKPINEASGTATTVPIGLTQTFTGASGTMTNDLTNSPTTVWGGGSCTPDANGPDAFWKFTLTRSTTVELKSGSSNYNHTLTLFTNAVAPIQCLNVNASATGTNITRTLAAGTYYVGIKSRNSNVGGTFSLSIRDTLAGVTPATSMGCSVNGYVDADLIAGTDYYIIVKGASGTLAPSASLVITDIGSVQANLCGDPSTADAYFDFSVADAAGRNVTISLNEIAGKLDGSFQLMKDNGVLNDASADTAVDSGCYALSHTYTGLAQGRYYVIVRAASLTGQSLPAEIFIKDENGANALDCAQVNNGSAGTITATLQPGTYYAAITTRNGGVGNTYKLQILDKAVVPPTGGTWMGCADSNQNLTVDIPPADGAVPYYAVVKGASAAAGAYTLTVTDLNSVQDTCATGDTIQMDPTAPDAYYGFKVTDADGGGRDVTVSLASTSALDGAYRLFRVDSPTVRTPIGSCHDKTGPYTYADLAPGSYYLTLRGKNVASGGANATYELSVNDQDAYGSLLCQNGTATTGTTITRTLNANATYWVGIKPQPGQSNPKDYRLQFRDTQEGSPVNATQIGCGTGVVNANVTAGKTYYALVKGKTSADKGAYGLTVTDLGGSAGWNCNDDSGAGDAYFEFNVDDPAGRRVTIDTENSALDTVLAIFPSTATIGAAGVLQCDDNSGAMVKSSKITRDLAPGVYYAAVRPALGAADPNLPFELSIRDESIYSSIACGATSPSGKAQIRTTLAPGTYHTVLKGMSGSAQGAYKVRFRDETPYMNAASEVACNDAQNELTYNVTAGKPYYAVVKGAAVSESGAYRLTVENVVARNGMGCNANATSPDAVYRFHLSADSRVQIDTLGSQTSSMTPVATDTVIALYDVSASYFGTNYALDRLNAPVNCDDNSGDLAKGWSKITADLAGNRDYYVVVQSKNNGWGGTTSLPYVVNVKDTGTNQPIACASASSSLLMTEPLPAGDYRVVVSNGTGPSGGGPFDVRFRNVTAASSGAAQVACADTPEEFTWNMVAGRPYYLMVKGDSASDRGQYGLVVETSGTGANSMGCNASPAAPDAFFKFQLASQAMVTIDTEGSTADTVIALYSGNTTVFGTNYSLDVNGVEVSCDDDGGDSAGASRIQTELSPGSYYVVVKGKTLSWNQTAQPFNLSIRDQSNTGSIACASDTDGNKKILENLPAGDYQVVMSTRSAAGGAYALKFRDTALGDSQNGARVACVSAGSLTVNNVAGGHDYYVVVKGNTATDSGGYTLTMEDTVSLAAASSNTSVACAAKGMTIDGTYPAGTYYALVTGKDSTASGPYTLSVRDADAINDQNRLACDDNGGPNLTSVIERDLASGTHYVVVKGNGEEARGAYHLHVRDTQAVPDRELLCAGADEAQRIQADVKAGQDYTVVLKGDASSASGNYDIKLYDQLGLQAGTGQNLKCLADPQPTPLVGSSWHTKALDFDLNLTPDTYYVAVKGQKAKDKGTFQLNIGEKSARTTTTYTPPTWTDIKDALATSGARVLPVIATGSEPSSNHYVAPAESQAKTIAMISGAVRKDDTPIWQKIQKDGTGTGSGLITGISDIADYLAMNVSLVAVDGPDPGASKFRINVAPGTSSSCAKHPLVDTSTGACAPKSGVPASCNTQYGCVPGSAPKFIVTFTNPSESPVPLNTNDAYGGYHFKLQIIGDAKYLLDEVPVYIIPTEHMPMGPPGGGSDMFRSTGVYTQDITTAACPKLSSTSGSTNDLPQWSDLFFSAGLPEGTSIDFELCTKEVEGDLKDCVWSNGMPGTRKKVTVRSKGTCASDSQCRAVPDYGEGFCESGACQFISEPKVAFDIACADNMPCPNGPRGAGEYQISSYCETTRGAYGYGHCVYTSQPADLGATLLTGEQGQPFARIRFTLHSDSTGMVAPTLYQWNLTYSCKSAQ